MSFKRIDAGARRVLAGAWLFVLAGGLVAMATRADGPMQAPAPDPGPRYENKSCTQCRQTTRQVLVDPDNDVWRCMQCGVDLWPTVNRVKK